MAFGRLILLLWRTMPSAWKDAEARDVVRVTAAAYRQEGNSLWPSARLARFSDSTGAGLKQSSRFRARISRLCQPPASPGTLWSQPCDAKKGFKLLEATRRGRCNEGCGAHEVEAKYMQRRTT